MRGFSRVSLVIGLLFWIAGALPVRACSLCSVEAGDGAMRQAFLKGESVELRRGPGPEEPVVALVGEKDHVEAYVASAGGWVRVGVKPGHATAPPRLGGGGGTLVGGPP